MALPKKPRPPIAPRMLGFDALAQAFLDDAMHRGRTDDHARYHEARLHALIDCMGCSFGASTKKEAGAVRAVGRDQRQVVNIARWCLEHINQFYGPFGTYMEGMPGPMELRVREAHKDAVNEAFVQVRASIRDTFVTCLRTLEPDLLERQVPESDLFARGVPKHAPKDDDDW